MKILFFSPLIVVLVLVFGVGAEEDCLISPSPKKAASAAEQNAAALLRAIAFGDQRQEAAWAALPEEHKAKAAAAGLIAGAPDLRRRALSELSKLKNEAGLWQEAKIILPALANCTTREPNENIRGAAFELWLSAAQYPVAGKTEAVSVVRDSAGAAVADIAAGRKAQGDLDEKNGVESSGQGERGGGGERQAAAAIHAMAAQLGRGEPLEQRRAVNALAAAGDGPVVLGPLIERFTEVWGKGPRGHIIFARQRAYIADYDVSGAVFDPVIRTYMSGVVLDVEQLRLEVEHLIYAGLKKLVVVDPGRDPRRWRQLLDDWAAKK